MVEWGIAMRFDIFYEEEVKPQRFLYSDEHLPPPNISLLINNVIICNNMCRYYFVGAESRNLI
jgi:hypothetical protein